MKLSSEPPEEIRLNMTAMIDIVFQLLVFFIMTFKVVAMEGDFTVKMPLASVNQEESMEDDFPTVINVSLASGANGIIQSIIVDDDATFSDPNTMYAQLTKVIEEKLAGEGNPEEGKETEVEFDIAPELKYRYTVQAIERVSGKILPDGSVKKLIKKIKFKDNSGGA